MKIFLFFQECDKIRKTITFRPKTNHFFPRMKFLQISVDFKTKSELINTKSKINFFYIIFMLIFHHFQWISLISCLFRWNWGIFLFHPLDRNFKWIFEWFSVVFDNVSQISISQQIELRPSSNKNFKMLYDQGFDYWDWI